MLEPFDNSFPLDNATVRDCQKPTKLDFLKLIFYGNKRENNVTVTKAIILVIFLDFANTFRFQTLSSDATDGPCQLNLDHRHFMIRFFFFYLNLLFNCISLILSSKAVL